MRARRGPAFFFGAGLAVVSAVYGFWGGIAGANLTLAQIDAGAELVDAALARLGKPSWGTDAFETAWLRGSVRLIIWDEAYDEAEDPPVRWKLLQQAAADFQIALSLEPGSGRALTGLADTYDRAEQETMDTRALDIAALDGGPWAQLGREGRISLGLRELAVALEPNVASRHGKLVRGLIEAGCKPEAEAAIKEAARVQPCFFYYKGFTLDTISLPLAEAFARASREALGTTPLLRRQRHLLCLGQLERALGKPETAYEDLTAAAAMRTGAQDRAEIQYWLGHTAADLGRDEEALAAFAAAGEFPAFRLGAADGRARVYRSMGRFKEALASLAEVRRSDPRNPDVLVAYARGAIEAGDTAAALEALRWAVLVRPDAAAAWTALVETLLSTGESAQAKSALDGMIRALGETDETRRLRDKATGSP